MPRGRPCARARARVARPRVFRRRRRQPVQDGVWTRSRRLVKNNFGYWVRQGRLIKMKW